MKQEKTKRTILGVHAPRPRLTLTGLTIIAAALALPVGAVLWLVEALLL